MLTPASRKPNDWRDTVLILFVACGAVSYVIASAAKAFHPLGDIPLAIIWTVVIAAAVIWVVRRERYGPKHIWSLTGVDGLLLLGVSVIIAVVSVAALNTGPWPQAVLGQCSGLAACVLAVSMISRELGAHVRGQTIAAVLCVTLPGAIRAGTGSNTELLLSFWVAAMVMYVLRLAPAGIAVTLAMVVLNAPQQWASSVDVLQDRWHLLLFVLSPVGAISLVPRESAWRWWLLFGGVGSALLLQYSITGFRSAGYLPLIILGAALTAPVLGNRRLRPLQIAVCLLLLLNSYQYLPTAIIPSNK